MERVSTSVEVARDRRPTRVAHVGPSQPSLIGRRDERAVVLRAHARQRLGPCACGWPAHSSGSSIRRRSGCPSNTTPKKSNTSRSNQFAAGIQPGDRRHAAGRRPAGRPSRGGGGRAPPSAGGRPPRTAGRPARPVGARRGRTAGRSDRPGSSRSHSSVASRSSRASDTRHLAPRRHDVGEARPELPRELVGRHRMRRLPLDLRVQLQDPVHQHLRAGAGTRDVDVDRHDGVDALDQPVVVEHARPRTRTRPWR